MDETGFLHVSHWEIGSTSPTFESEQASSCFTNNKKGGSNSGLLHGLVFKRPGSFYFCFVMFWTTTKEAEVWWRRDLVERCWVHNGKVIQLSPCLQTSLPRYETSEKLSWTLQTKLATNWIPLSDLNQQHSEKDDPVEPRLNSWHTTPWKKETMPLIPHTVPGSRKGNPYKCHGARKNEKIKPTGSLPLKNTLFQFSVFLKSQAQVQNFI